MYGNKVEMLKKTYHALASVVRGPNKAKLPQRPTHRSAQRPAKGRRTAADNDQTPASAVI